MVEVFLREIARLILLRLRLMNTTMKGSWEFNKNQRAFQPRQKRG